jgi:SAM-dependent methyltransferase
MTEMTKNMRENESKTPHLPDVQVRNQHYFTAQYNHKSRWLSYFYQIKLIRQSGAKMVLEIGPGNGWVSMILQSLGIKVSTADIDPELHPDYVADIKALPFADDSFDVVCAFEVLEHMPFDSFGANLRELSRVAKKKVILSLPDKRKTLLNLSLKIPFIRSLSVCIKIPTFSKHVFDGQHYWEIGKLKYSVGDIKRKIKQSGLLLEQNFLPHDAPTMHFFVLSKRREI